jgi:S-formylglutathione hydrolase
MKSRVLKKHRAFGGTVSFNEHDSDATGTVMKYSTFVPDGKINGCLIWLSGLTCTDENFMAKAGAQKHLAEHGLMVVCPDTSPRGLDLPGEHKDWDFGSGASFYVDALTEGYRDHYRMFTYINDEFYHLIESDYDLSGRISISGHSMGGHGALVLGLRHKEKYHSVSAFAPIVHPAACPWGKKAFSGYLGSDEALWKTYDACELVRSGHSHSSKILIDQGLGDDFLKTQLLTEEWTHACQDMGQPTEVRRQEGYDHSYYFISTFIADHVRFHAGYLR